MIQADRRFIEAAIRLAVNHEGYTGTNPSVACILAKDLGSGPVIIGTGVTAVGGRPHAEPIALAEAGKLAEGATAYVSLEPCAHHGSTPPCAQTMIDAGIARVVTAMIDPDSRVSGKGHQMLRDAGIEVTEMDSGTGAEFGLAGYLKRKETGMPFVTLKLAVSSNGYLGIEGQGQVPVTGKASRRQVHLMRAMNDAILIGSGTANADDPELTCRLPGLEHRSPTRIVVGGRSQLDPSLKLLSTANAAPTLLVVENTDHSKRLLSGGAEILPPDRYEGQVALPEMLEDIGARGISTVMVEGGARLATSFLTQGLVDRICLFVSENRLLNEKTDKMGVPSPVVPGKIPDGFAITDQFSLPNGGAQDHILLMEKAGV